MAPPPYLEPLTPFSGDSEPLKCLIGGQDISVDHCSTLNLNNCSWGKSDPTKNNSGDTMSDSASATVKQAVVIGEIDASSDNTVVESCKEEHLKGSKSTDSDSNAAGEEIPSKSPDPPSPPKQSCFSFALTAYLSTDLPPETYPYNPISLSHILEKQPSKIDLFGDISPRQVCHPAPSASSICASQATSSMRSSDSRRASWESQTRNVNSDTLIGTGTWVRPEEAGILVHASSLMCYEFTSGDCG